MEHKETDLIGSQSQIKSKERVSKHGEVFTADREVNAMLDLVKPETERIESRFLEPACGNGNFLANILQRKLDVVAHRYGNVMADYQLNAWLATSSIYGIELLMDNVEECRLRLFSILHKNYQALFSGADGVADAFFVSVRYVLSHNICWGDALTARTPSPASHPIVFSEWSLVGRRVKRRDFTLDSLMHNQPLQEANLFSDLGDAAFIPKPLREFPLTDYLNVADYGE
jgi:hypothetical protein